MDFRAPSLFCVFSFAALFASQSSAFTFSQTEGVRSCGTVVLPTSLQQQKVHELSGIVQTKPGRIVMVSDRGKLVHAELIFNEAKTLTGVTLHLQTPLRNAEGKAMSKLEADAEGLAYDKKTNSLYISFERDPRVERYALDGQFIERIKIAPQASDSDYYNKSNQALEALTLVDDKVLTGPERATSPKGEVALFDDKGIRARYPLFIPSHKKNALTGLDSYGDKIFSVERDYHKRKKRLIISVHEFKLPAKRGELVKKTLKVAFNNQKGAIGLDNFEGIVALSEKRVLLVSDDGGGKKQRSLLTCLDFTP